MKLADLHPSIIDDRVLWFDCPRHAGDETQPCHGVMGIPLRPALDGSPGNPRGWAWSGDWSTFDITLHPSLESGLCKTHINVLGGEIQFL